MPQFRDSRSFEVWNAQEWNHSLGVALTLSTVDCATWADEALGHPGLKSGAVRLQRRVIRGCESPRARALGSETEGNCVAARRGGEHLEVNGRSAT